LARVYLVVRPLRLNQGTLELQLILLLHLFRAIQLRQHFRQILLFRRLLAVLGDLWVPLPRVAQLVRSILVGQVALETQLILLFRRPQAFLMGPPLRNLLPFLAFRRVLANQAVQAVRAARAAQVAERSESDHTCGGAGSAAASKSPRST